MAPPVSGFNLNKNGVPNFEDLPLRKDAPRLAAWGLYGDDDQLGFLNRLTDERVAAAAREEIKTGKRVSLNWPMTAQPHRAFFGRAVFHQEVINKAPRTVNDDTWSFNTQVSSQWDGLRHFGYQDEKVFYGGVTQRDIHSRGEGGERSEVLGIHSWSEEGIMGRGVLIDYHSWRTSPEGRAQSKVENYDAFETVSIPLEDLEACLKAQDTELKFGDILFIRSGFMAALATKSSEQIWNHQDVVPHPFGGVQQSEEVLRWIWDHFSAVAGDQPSFEVWPSKEKWAMHEVLLAGWGCPIGELFDLEKLADTCKKEGRWSFFCSSEPCNVPGGVASPPNAVAIF
ncbi:hypothetical protein F5Y18DRAFT_160580 [Xylariaceae sp. FL1019]|nr:hypothetical protein F5Y18DRAFT_160580 [Xylariaceae sp. FL1019]